MIRVNLLRDKKDSIIERLSIKNFNNLSIINDIINLDDDRKSNQLLLDNSLSKVNNISKDIANLYKSGDSDKAGLLKHESKQLKENIKDLQIKQNEIEKNLNHLLYQVPNIPHRSVPVGETDVDNQIIKQVGILPERDKCNKPHWEIAKEYNLIDFDLGNKITGSGFPVYVNKGAKLQRSLVSFFLDKNINVGYTEYLPPHLVNEKSGFGTGQLPKFEDDLYKFSDENDLYLIPTAEVPITNLYRNLIFDQTDLPVKATAYTPCFRREAGSYGKDVRGLNRLHQFDKVEIVQIQHPDLSYDTLDEMVSHIEGILTDLELPYRIVRLCGGDLGFSSALTFDFEVYSAAQDRWLEVSSVSNFEDFQSNRLKLRFRDNDGKIKLCHTLNGSALALPRVLAAMLENNQSLDGIKIPEILHSYTGFSVIK